MNFLYSALTLIGFLAAAYGLSALLRPKGICEALLYGALSLAGTITTCAYLLSELNRLGNQSAWMICGLLIGLISLALSYRLLGYFPAPKINLGERLRLYRAGFRELSSYQQIILIALGGAVLIGGLINLALVLLTPSPNWDSQVYHLPRLAYYLQQNSFDPYPANYTHQLVNPLGSTALLVFLHITTPNENFYNFSQYAAYWLLLLSIYAAGRKLGVRPYFALISALMTACLTVVLLEASTAQNDLVVAAYLAIALYALLAYQSEPRPAHIIAFSVAAGLALGAKATAFMALPALGVLLIFILVRVQFQGQPAFYLPRFASPSLGGGIDSKKSPLLGRGEARQGRGEVKKRKINAYIFLLFAVFIAALIFVLPAGYIQNQRAYGGIAGPPDYVARHSFQDESPLEIMRGGALNSIRFALLFISADGLPPSPLMKGLSTLREGIGGLFAAIGLDPADSQAAAVPFLYDNYQTPIPYQPYSPYPISEDLAYWGILGLLIWPVALWSLINPRSSTLIRLLILGGLGFILIYACAGPYDPWKGRHLMIALIFIMPALGWGLSEAPKLNKWKTSGLKMALKALMLLIVLLACLSVAYSLRDRTWGGAIFGWERSRQIALRHSEFGATLATYESLVPPDARVAVWVHPNNYEYALFGADLKRRIIPAGLIGQNLITALNEADYLVYSLGIHPDFASPAPDDILLGAHLYPGYSYWYLRPLRP